MKNNFIGEIAISLVLLSLLIFFVNPMDITMPEQMHAFMGPTLVIFFAIVLGVSWKETAGDEREGLHKLIASRFAYFAGIAVLLVGIIVQSSHRVLDSWLVITVVVMLLAKIVGLMYGYLKR
jgi:cobalamin synthase